MEKYIVDIKGRAEEYFQGAQETKKINFPLCLALKYGDDVSAECPNFLLNTRKGKVFVETKSPLAEGSKVLLHFYIPEAKLLSEFEGKVISQQNEGRQPKGNLIKIRDVTRRRLHQLEEYLEEKRHLIDEKV
ncbi:MAG: hypothetical protein HZC49_10420 [Nitrospirae bacterium]|nr:hypothetical protein [Nitrospirota bacterium]